MYNNSFAQNLHDVPNSLHTKLSYSLLSQCGINWNILPVLGVYTCIGGVYPILKDVYSKTT